jgi:hypothetical protein
MPGQWEAPRWWGTNIYRTIAWLKAPSDEEEYASFQLAPDPSDGVECLPEVYALETSNPIFTLIWYRLRKAFASRRRVLTLTSWPNSDVVDYTPDGKVVVRTVITR